ncbi:MULTISPECIES: MIP family channel protein [Nocardioides]|uniref:MIP family channel protein n=1 Tax=Nocardioides vastitatis TaxID=2568655 RepID=A0ABW0ZDQ5_9ACTN|nr:MIP family channel protein [Nocardioides sp.]THI95653.1 MIP family channel protein [Nocardioides sp.]
MTDVATADTAADTAPPPLAQKLLAEFLGTFVLVLFGCGVAVMTGADIVATGLAFGLTVTLMAYAVGRISGGHFNPAVSIGAAIGGRVSWKDAGAFIGAQFVGGIVAAFVLMILALGLDGFEAFDSSTPLGANGFSEGPFDYAVWAALLVELIMTFLFVLVILAVTDERNAVNVVMAPLAIGVTLAVIHFMLIPLTGTSVNPARSLGPALFSGGDWIIQVWPFLIAPTIGGALAGLVYPLAFGRGADPVPGSGFGGGARPNPFEQQWNQQQGGGFGQPQQEQPIIQDGWQWDPAAQQWIPAQQPPPPAADPQAPPQGGWAPPAGDQTVVRPPQ